MATVCEAQKYALNCVSSLNKNKTFVFVKLTDSALKAIEDYLLIKDNAASKPTIQFQSNSNQGTLCFPNASSDPNSDSERRFSFNLSHVDADGPQGSFECIRQTRYKGMESLGSMHYKMQIHASEDSYQKTKARMAVAEQESKKNCTKVIKESGPSVGRKVKVKKGFSQNPGLTTNSSSSISSSLLNGKPHSPPVLKLNGASIPNGSQNGTSIMNGLNKVSTGSLGTGSNGGSYNKTSSSGSSPQNPELMRRPLRERIIHLLALRPYKKPELLARLMRDGIREKDKKGLSLLLNQICQLKDNAYNLAKHAWHEVQIEDWPYYTAEERDVVRKRNQLTNQNQHSAPLTTLSPLSSDCSSLQDSPSPPSLVNLNVNSPSYPSKRPIESSSNLLKKQRTAHLTNFHQQQQQQQQQQPQQTQQPHHQPPAHPKAKSPNVNLQGSGYTDVLNGWVNKPKSPETNKTSGSTGSSAKPVSNGTAGLWNGTNGALELRPDSLSSNKSDHPSPDSNGITVQSQSANQPVGAHLTNGYSGNANNSNASKKTVKNGYIYRNSSATNLTPNFVNSHQYGNGSVNSTPNSSPDSGTGSNDGSVSTTSSRSMSSVNGESHDYVVKYVEITNDEQREKYKMDFNKEYKEYRRLHRLLGDKVKRFELLEQELKSAAEGSEEWNKVMDQILKEYEEAKKNKFDEVNKRVQHLHEKLSHIKKLVLDYDKQHPQKLKKAGRSKKWKRTNS